MTIRVGARLAAVVLGAMLTIGFFADVGTTETISWTLPTTFTDNTMISATEKARITVYLRGYKASNPTAKTYFGETRNGGTTWGVANDNTYIMTKMNQWASTNAVPGWIPIVQGDNVYVTASAAITWTDASGVTREYDGPESPPLAYTIPKPPPPTPSCNAPLGLTIR